MSSRSWPHLCFILSMALGSLLALFAPNWMHMYAGMELNMFAFIPLMIQHHTNKEHEASIKYFLIQLFGSILLLFGGLWLLFPSPPAPPKYLLILGLLIKAGAAPAHAWFPPVMSGLTWPICLLLSTWQKLFPLLFLFFNLTLTSPTPLLILFSGGSLIGALGGLNQTSLRGLLAYSSISHIGWMLSASLFSPTCAVFYLLAYILTTSTIMLLLSTSKSHPTNKMISPPTFPLPQKTILTISFLSLAGIPPMLGFLPKWQTLETLLILSPWCAIPLLLASATSLFFYLKIIFLFSTSSPPTPPPPHSTPPLMIFMFLMISNLILIPPFLLS